MGEAEKYLLPGEAPCDAVLRLGFALANDLMDFALDWPDELWDKIVELREVIGKADPIHYGTYAVRARFQ